LIPQLQKRLSSAATASQVTWLLAGVALVTLVSRATLHAHG
jgi:zinc and cadmium transporter